VKITLNFLNGISYISLRCIIAYIESFPKHYNKVFIKNFLKSLSKKGDVKSILAFLENHEVYCRRFSAMLIDSLAALTSGMTVIAYFNRINSVIVHYLHLSIRTLKNKKLNNTRKVFLSFEHSRLLQISFIKRFLLQFLNIFIIKNIDTLCCI